MQMSQKIEAILFFKGEPVKVRELAQLLSSTEGEIREGILELTKALENRGLTLIDQNESVELRTRAEMADLFVRLQKEELARNIGRAGSETLAIVLYSGMVARSEIDYIRGVNSTFILRNLLIRGLVEKVSNPRDKRSYLYKPTHELLAHLGITHVGELPEYEAVSKELKFFKTEEEGEDDYV